MIKTLKFNPDTPLFWTSDIHDSHAKDFLLKPRGFKSADEARENLITSWNKQCNNDAIVFHLGDIVIGAGPNGLQALEGLLNQLVFKELYLMAGNHPSGWTQLLKKAGLEDGQEWTFGMDQYSRIAHNHNGRTIYFIPNYWECSVGHQFIAMCHYPIASWNNLARNGWCLSGHCHSNYKPTRWQSTTGKQLDVGIESALSYHNRDKTLFSFEDLQNIMSKKELISEGHHQ